MIGLRAVPHIRRCTRLLRPCWRQNNQRHGLSSARSASHCVVPRRQASVLLCNSVGACCGALRARQLQRQRLKSPTVPIRWQVQRVIVLHRRRPGLPLTVGGFGSHPRFGQTTVLGNPACFFLSSGEIELPSTTTLGLATVCGGATQSSRCSIVGFSCREFVGELSEVPYPVLATDRRIPANMRSTLRSQSTTAHTNVVNASLQLQHLSLLCVMPGNVPLFLCFCRKV